MSSNVYENIIQHYVHYGMWNKTSIQIYSKFSGTFSKWWLPAAQHFLEDDQRKPKYHRIGGSIIFNAYDGEGGRWMDYKQIQIEVMMHQTSAKVLKNKYKYHKTFQ